MPSSPTRPATSRRLRRSLGVVLTTSALLAPLTLLGPAQAADTVHRDSADEATLALDVLGTFRTNVFDASAAEIVTFHAATQRTFVVNAESGEIDVLDAADPTAPTLVGAIVASDAAAIGEGAVANSVAIRPDGLVVAAIEAPTKTDAGWLLFADAASLEILGTVQVGALPDMVAVTPDGTRAVVANEGEPADDFSLDPEGSVGVVDLPATVAAPTQEAVRTATFHEFEADGSRTLDPAVRIFGPTPEEGNPVSRNLEPEYVAIAPDGTTAYAVLQEANAVAVVDLATATVTDIWPLGAKDHSVPGQGFDPSDRDSASKGPEIKIGEWPVKGLYMPDGINAYQASGSTYLVTANEGDAREWGDYEEPSRVKDLGKGGVPPICEDSPLAELRGDAALGRLNVSTASGLNEAGTCFDELYSFGSRSFSIWTTDGTQVFDSGDDFEQTVARVVPNYFNSNHSESNFEGRSDDKGPEPENLTIGTVGGRTYAFIGLERVGGVMVYDISDPANAEYVTYVNNRDFAVSVEDGIEEAADPAAFLASAGDLGPEGLTFVSATDSPTGEALVIVGNEVSGTTTFFGVTDLVEPEPAPFTDVTSTHVFFSEISWLAGRGITTGYAEADGTTTFRPSQPVLREQMAAFLYRFAGQPTWEAPAVSPFTDVAPTHTFYREITWLADQGVTTGYAEADGTTTFRPSQPVLREQMAAFLYRTAGSDFVDEDGPTFSDVPTTATFFDEIEWLAMTDITTGYLERGEAPTFRGSESVLREQMAAFLYRFDQLSS
ncbi:choice-of-anchor I family protein [Aeromicrobium sp.]|uniref:choice-of-anchor I family protein n=1 Tax=Aeromicrobium sp. TaxID=1871063 RepID=UPI0025BA343C|nr:choice-of-anchor I family protein [Aeromicrobium sp.]